MALKEALIKSFDRLRTNGNALIPFVVPTRAAAGGSLSSALLSLSKGVNGINVFRASLKSNFSGFIGLLER